MHPWLAERPIVSGLSVLDLEWLDIGHADGAADFQIVQILGWVSVFRMRAGSA
jgi:hypothetical protein